MYGFYDMKTKGIARTESTHKLMYDGVNLDDELTTESTSFVTLSVTGRGMAQRKHVIDEQDGIDGATLTGINYLPRTLTVKVRVSAVDDDEFRMLMERLNRLLSKRTDVEVKFSDEEYYYLGHYMSGSTPEELTNMQVLELTLFCGNPFKFAQDETLTVENGGNLNVKSDFPVKPTIEMTFAEPVKVATITNTESEKVLKINSTVAKTKWTVQMYGDPVKNDSVINKSHLKYLPLDSDFADFFIEAGHRIVVQPVPATLKIKYRGVKL